VPLGEGTPIEQSAKERYALKSRYFTAIGMPGVKPVANKHRLVYTLLEDEIWIVIFLRYVIAVEWPGGIMVRASRTRNRQIVGSTPGLFTAMCNNSGQVVLLLVASSIILATGQREQCSATEKATNLSSAKSSNELMITYTGGFIRHLQAECLYSYESTGAPSRLSSLAVRNNDDLVPVLLSLASVRRQ